MASDDEMTMMCFTCYGDSNRCSCASKAMRGNIPYEPPVVKEQEPLLSEDATETTYDPDEEPPTQLEEPLTQKMDEPEEEPPTQLEEPPTNMDDEVLTQLDDEVLTQLDDEPSQNDVLAQLDQTPVQAPKAKAKAKAKAKTMGSVKPKGRKPQKALDLLKLTIKEMVKEHGPVTFGDLLQLVRSDMTKIYGKKLASGKLVVRNFLANRRMKWLVVDRDGAYSFDPNGGDERPTISAETWVELLKEDKVCYAQYAVAYRYFELLRPHLKKNTAKCALHAALRQNNGQGGRVYGFIVDALPKIPTGGKVKKSAQALEEFFL